jgi:hypothetical protein
MTRDLTRKIRSTHPSERTKALGRLANNGDARVNGLPARLYKISVLHFDRRPTA